MTHKRATNIVIRNLEHDHPDYYLHKVWERLSLVSLESFQTDARRWLADKSELRGWSLDNADWREVYAHFVSEADKQIETHNQLSDRLPDEDPAAYLLRMTTQLREEKEMASKWAEYGPCKTCEVGTGIQCVNKRNGEPAKNAHPGRPKVGAKLPAEPATTSKAHGMIISQSNLAGMDTFKATCACGELDGANITSRYLAEQEYQRHIESALVSA